MHMYNEWKNRCFIQTLERMSTSDLWNYIFPYMYRPTHMCISTLIYEPWIRALAERAEFVRLSICIVRMVNNGRICPDSVPIRSNAIRQRSDSDQSVNRRWRKTSVRKPESIIGHVWTPHTLVLWEPYEVRQILYRWTAQTCTTWYSSCSQLGSDNVQRSRKFKLALVSFDARHNA